MHRQALWAGISQGCEVQLKGERIRRLGVLLPKLRCWNKVEAGALVKDFSVL